MSSIVSQDLSSLPEIGAQALDFLESLRVNGRPGVYAPCARGATRTGRAMSLPWSCFALKIVCLLNAWDAADDDDRLMWRAHICAHQRPEDAGAFVDPAESDYIVSHASLGARLRSLLGKRPRPLPHSHPVILAETKQAIASLATAGYETDHPFTGFPMTPESVRAFLEKRDWSRPWGAGGQAAGLVVFLCTEAPRILSPRDAGELLTICRDFYARLADPHTGAYFRGSSPPEHGEMINGAMKVLMALDWLGLRPQYAEKLVATCISRPTASRGCHLVDAIYVLHQCLAPGEASAAVRDYCRQILAQIAQHRHADGGFSFHRGRAQTVYYGVRISRGLPEGDIQGTCLLLWALAMIWRVLEPESASWEVFRP